MRDELLNNYERELLFLRRSGADFARKYPKIAARLLLDGERGEDPHVERLLEGFALLAARINLKLEDELPEITESFLNVLYPHYLAPIPSLAVVQMEAGSPKHKMTAVQKIERGTQLFSRSVDGAPCRFRTCYDVELAPLEIESAALESDAPTDVRGRFAEARLRLSLRVFGSANLHELKKGATDAPLERLRFFLNGDPQLVFPLYELIFNNCTGVELRAKEMPVSNASLMLTMSQMKPPPAPIHLAPNAVLPVGFEPDEGLLPFSARSFSGYRLLSEYFAFPYKFLFFDIGGIRQAVQAKFGGYFDIIIHLKEFTPPRVPIAKETFALNCTPIINLFKQTSDPIYLSHQKFEYHLQPDVHRQTATEIYSIDEVFTTDPRTNKTREFTPFYAQKHALGEQLEKSFWYASRRASARENDEGTEMFLSFVDSSFNPREPQTEIVHVRATCTNRDLPGKLPFGGRAGDFEIEGAALVSRINCLTKPTETIRPPMRRGAHWRLISHLNLNYLSLTANENGTPEALQEILELYNLQNSAAVRQQILGITKIETRRVMRQIGERIGTGFVRGIETTLTFDEEKFVGSGLYLFACVLNRFLGLYVSLNSFNQLVVKTVQREDTVKKFESRTGEKILM